MIWYIRNTIFKRVECNLVRALPAVARGLRVKSCILTARGAQGTKDGLIDIEAQEDPLTRGRVQRKEKSRAPEMGAEWGPIQRWSEV